VAGQAAEQIIAGVVLSERLAVTMYGAIHRAQFNGARNLRGLVIDAKMLAETGFRIALTDAKSIAALTRLDHPGIVPTVTVESGGADVVVVTRGVGRYVSVQDLISAARADKASGGKLSLPVAGTIGKAVIEALAAAHAIGVVHGAVHPRSVLIDEDGAVRLTDFVVGRALTTAVAQGADSSLWRGLAGYLAPELVVGEDPAPPADVFAVGAMLFTMLTGEAPPGALHATPAVERLVQRALDTDTTRRYKSAADLLENLLEAYEDDHWELAARGELIKAAGLSQSDGNIDDATEDLLASLGGPGLGSVQVTPIRPSQEMRAERLVARQEPTGVAPGKRLDALLTDLEEPSMTNVDVAALRPDPISEIIKRDPRKDEAIVSVGRDDARVAADGGAAARRPSSRGSVRSSSQDEVAALDAIAGLDEPVRRVSTAADAAEAAVAKLTEAAARAEAAARVIDTGKVRKADPTDIDPPRRGSGDLGRATPVPSGSRVGAPLEPIAALDGEPPKLTKPVNKIIGVLALAVLAGGGYGVYWKIQSDRAETEKNKKDRDDLQKKLDAEAAAQTQQNIANQVDPGTLRINANPGNAAVWLNIGKTPLTSLELSAKDTHQLALTHDGFDAVEAEVTADKWTTSDNTKRVAHLSVSLPAHTEVKPKPPHDPTLPPLQSTGLQKPTGLIGKGPLVIESTPPGSDVWLFLGAVPAEIKDIPAGRAYEVLVQKTGYKPKRIAIVADDWRVPGDTNPNIDAAKKKDALDIEADLEKEKK
jgi:hypothetical protein